MIRTVDVIYEDNVLKPLMPLEGLRERERVVVILCHRSAKEGLRELVGTLTHEEAEAMQKVIDDEFGKIEDEW